MHSLLKRQLKRSFGDESSIPQELWQFVDAINSAYQEFDADRAMLERSLDLSSQELLQANAAERVVVVVVGAHRRGSTSLAP